MSNYIMRDAIQVTTLNKKGSQKGSRPTTQFEKHKRCKVFGSKAQSEGTHLERVAVTRTSENNFAGPLVQTAGLTALMAVIIYPVHPCPSH